MFVPPPSKVNLEIVAQSLHLPFSRRFRQSPILIGLGFAGCVLLGASLIFTNIDPGNQEIHGSISSEMEVDAFEVYAWPGPFVSPKEVTKAWPLLDKAIKQMEQENKSVLLSRAPLEGPGVEAATTQQKLVASSGDWLLGRVRLSESGLVIIRPDLAVFEKGVQQAVFRPGAVLPNGEVVIEVNANELLIKTNMRFIQIVDDGA